MDLIREFSNLTEAQQGGVIALGNFDGIHAGHKKVIAEANKLAQSLCSFLGVMSFEPHPRSFLRPDEPPFRLTPLDVKLALLEKESVTKAYIVEFNEAFREVTAADFLDDLLKDQLKVRGVVAGHDFCFGKGRSGNAALLEAWGKENNIEIVIVPEEKNDQGNAFSSTQLRAFLRQGDVVAAAHFLGRPWEIDGIVIQGDQRGRKIGFPTANIDLGNYLRPAFGVYAVRVQIAGQEQLGWLPAVANIGRRPTFNKDHDLLEVHLFDFDQDIYGQKLRVQLVEHIRPERKFDGIEALVAQIHADSLQAQKLLSENKE